MAKTFEEIGTEIGRLVQEKNLAYGDSFNQSHLVLQVFYPNGVMPHQYKDMLAVTRIIDKLFRVANDKGYAGESPFKDICGYAILSIEGDERTKGIV
jgi:hypothetical protein